MTDSANSNPNPQPDEAGRRQPPFAAGEASRAAGADAFVGRSEVAQLLQTTDWSRSALGPLEHWPGNLRSAINMILPAEFPMLIAWGPDFHLFYNDAYRLLIADKHPGALGAPARTTFPELWEVIKPLFERAMDDRPVAQTDMLVPLHRSGYLENTWFTFSYSPIRDDAGNNAGLFCTAVETTERVEAERRLMTLSELASRTVAANDTNSVASSAAKVLGSNVHDVPFALLFLCAGDGHTVRLAAAAGLTPGQPGAPVEVDLRQHDQGWPLADALRRRDFITVTDLPARFGALPGGDCPEATHTALALPLALDGDYTVFGVLVAGVSPRRALDDKYRAFYRLMAENIAVALATATGRQAERQRADRLAELDRAKTEFFSNVSHEFRTPLTLILGPVEDALADPARTLAGDKLQLVRRNVLRLSRMVNALLDFSRMEAGRAQATFIPVDLAVYTADLASAFRSAVENAGLALTVDCPPLPQMLYVDVEMWEKLVLNLLSNALKYTHHGQIRLALRWQDDHAILTVQDTGVGIPKAELPRVFERFHRVWAAQGRSHEGSGIGLALVQEIIKLHGGTISVDSRLGAGTTFTVTLPAGTAHLPPEHVSQKPLPQLPTAGATALVDEVRRWGVADVDPGSPAPGLVDPPRPPAELTAAHILLADDNADLRSYVADLLRRFYTEVETAPDGRAALAAARERPPDLILADVMMPGLDGFSLVRELRGDERTSLVPIVLLSARTGAEAAVEGLESGADDYLIKPFSARELVARVRVQLEMARVRRSVVLRDFEKQELHAILEARDEFLAMASHELRTPLTALKLQVHGLLRDQRGTPDEHRAAQLENLNRSVDRLAQLVNDLLDVSRITSGRLSLQPEETDLAGIVRAAVERKRARATRDTEVILSVPDSVTGCWDRNRLDQVLTKLLSNALKYGAGKPVELRVEADADRVRLRVSDQGIGIAAEEQARIFERFERAVPMRHFGGLGLGLWIARQLVDAMGGSIKVESTEGQGATFIVDLPRRPQRPDEPAD